MKYKYYKPIVEASVISMNFLMATPENIIEEIKEGQDLAPARKLYV